MWRQEADRASFITNNSQNAIFHFLSDTEKLLAFSITYRVTIFFSVREAVVQLILSKEVVVLNWITPNAFKYILHMHIYVYVSTYGYRYVYNPLTKCILCWTLEYELSVEHAR